MEFKEFTEFTDPLEKDYDITSSFTDSEKDKRNVRVSKVKREFTKLLFDLGFPELEELAFYGISEEEYMNPSIDTLKKLKEYAMDIKYRNKNVR